MAIVVSPLFADPLDLDGDRRTPIPPFDMDAYARESESSLVPAGEAPPPSLEHDALLHVRLADCALRAQFLANTLRVGAVSREEAARIARRELHRVERAAQRTREGALCVVLGRLCELVEELGGISGEPEDDLTEEDAPESLPQSGVVEVDEPLRARPGCRLEDR
jgi:hypothetical protein